MSAGIIIVNGEQGEEEILPSDTTDREAVVLIIAILRVQIAGIEVQVVRVRATVAYGRPIVAVRPAIVKRP